MARLTEGAEAFFRLTQLRDAGWMVAVHNDYRLNGETMTFWLLTHPDGRWIKGEGPTDLAALTDAGRAALQQESEADG